MILGEDRLREIVALILSEDLKFNGPYNDDFNISGVNESESVIDISEKQSVKVYRFSRILEALTNPARQNVAAWKYVAEQMLENRGFVSTNSPRQMPSVFGDTVFDDCLYAVKSSFQKRSNTWNSVINYAKLNRVSLFDESGRLKAETFSKNNCNAGGMIFCFRRDISEEMFSINWFKTEPVVLETLSQLAIDVFAEASSITSSEKIIQIFGNPEPFWQIKLRNYSKGDNLYSQKLELYDMIDDLPEEKYELLMNYVKDLLTDS